jgi:hypothetical protein
LDFVTVVHCKGFPLSCQRAQTFPKAATATFAGAGISNCHVLIRIPPLLITGPKPRFVR